MNRDWLNWVWLDWEVPARQRVTEAGALLEALRHYGNPFQPNAAHYVVFRATLDILPASQVPEMLPPSVEWVQALYQDFLKTLQRERPEWLQGKQYRDRFQQQFEQLRQQIAKENERRRPLEEAQAKFQQKLQEEAKERERVRT